MHRDATVLRRALVLCGCALLSVAGEASAAIPASERAALIAFYNSTDGANWIFRFRPTWRNATDTDFAPPGTECTWAGVGCDPAESHVTRLDLPGVNACGPLPPEIGDLKGLTFLSLAYNCLTGPIPPQIGNLSQLADLELPHNQLSGSIPPEIGNLSSLGLLLLYSNELSGSIPPEIGNLSSLRTLDLGSNELSGSIPPEIGSLERLLGLGIGENQLTGSIPPEIGNLSRLWSLWLAGNHLSGSIPPEIGNLTNLNQLDLRGNELSGSIPPEIGNLTKLQTLDLGLNQLSGSIPPDMGRIEALSYLSLALNRLTGSIPPEIGGLAKLSSLYASGNQLSGSIPPEIGRSADLFVLDLGDNQLSGAIPREIGGHVYLWQVILAGNQLSGSIPPEIFDLPSLQYLDLGRNQLSGPIPPEIGRLSMSPYLMWGIVRLDHNRLTGSIPRETGDVKNLLELSLGGNELSGSIPPEIGKVATLATLDLSDNRLSGPIPSQLGSLRYLSAMLLQGNRLAGPIPSTLANLTALEDGASDFRWNALHTSNDALRAFLDQKQIGGDFESTQTVAPAGLGAGSPTLAGVSLTWSPILYTGDTGSYRIWYGTQAGGPYSFGGATADKAASAATVGGLSPGTSYFFSLETVTEPHANNRNTVVSERVEVSAATAPGGEGWPVLAVVTHGLGTVSSSPGSIACGLACSATFAPGTAVTLAARPEPGSTFLGWGGACAGTALACDLTMDSAQTVTAAFSTPAVSFYTITPCRVFDSRDAGLGGPAALAARSDNAIQVAGHCGVPATAKAVSLNVTVVAPSAGGHLRVFALGTARPATSSISYASGQTRANNAVVSLGAGGALAAYVSQTSGTTHLVLDVNGYFQ